VEECLILCDVVSSIEMEVKGIPWLIAARGYEVDPSAHPLKHEGAVEAHGLVLQLGRSG